MKKSFAIVAVLVTMGTAGGALALSNSVHHKTTHGQHQQVTSMATQHAVAGTKASTASHPTSSPFVLCQRQDPTTPALRAGAGGCMALPY